MVRQSKAYTVANRNGRDRTALLEHPRRHEFTLVDTDRPAETAADVYHFELKVPAGKTEMKTVTEEQVIVSKVPLGGDGDDQVHFFQNATITSPALKQALQRALELRWAAQRTQWETGRRGCCAAGRAGPPSCCRTW